MKRKKLMSLITMVLVITSVSAGCNSKKEVSTKEDKKEVVDTYAPDESKKYTISWTYYQITPPEKDAEMIKYIEDKFNVKMDVWNLDSSKYDEMLNVRLASGEIPDLFRVAKPESLGGYVDQGVLAELPQEVLKKYAPNILKITNDNAAGFMDFGKIDGKQYGIPSVNATNIFRKPLVYKKEWMNNLGVTKTPETLDEFEALMYKFANNDPDKNGKKDTYGLSQTGLLALYGAYGYVSEINTSGSDMYFANKDGKLVLGSIQPEMKEVLTRLNKWYKDGVLDPEFITGENQGGYKYLSHAFIKGRIGFSTLGNYYHWLPRGAYQVSDGNGGKKASDPGVNNAEMEKLNVNADVAFGMPLKATATSKPGIKAYNRLMNFYGIGKTAGEEKGKMAKVLQILDYISANPDLTTQTMMSSGIEGKHWAWTDKEHGEIKILSPYDKIDNYNYKIGARLNMDVPNPPIAAREQWAFQNNFDKYGIESAIQIGVPAFTQYSGELMKLRDAAYISIITGDKPVSYFDEFVKKYNSIGGDEVAKQANEWYAKTQKK